MSRMDGSLSRKKVVHVTTAHHADDVRIFDRECRSLAETGLYDVFLAAPGLMPSGYGVTHIPLLPKPSKRARRFIEGPRKGLALSKAIDADLWHFHDPELLPVALKLARAGHKVIWDAHEDYEEQLNSNGSKTWVPGVARGMVRFGTRVLLRRVDKLAAGVVCATPTIATKYSNPRTVVVGNEARLETFADCEPTFESKQILFSGSAGPGHLFREVVEAIALIPEVTLVVAGREPDPEIWQWSCRILGDRFRHVGWLDRQALASAISESLIGVVTYANIPTYEKGLSTKCIEFVAGGLPFVATPNEANRRVAKASKAGFLAEGFRSEDLCSAIKMATKHRDQWEIASRSGRAWAQQEGNWQLSESRLLDLYSKVLEEHTCINSSSQP